jgi:hypothetical protein
MEWKHHEMNMHRLVWSCDDHGCVFTTQADLVEHVRETHSERLTETQMSILVDMSQRPVGAQTIACCTMCSHEYQVTGLYEHMAEHLESLALFSLTAEPQSSGRKGPNNEEEDHLGLKDNHLVGEPSGAYHSSSSQRARSSRQSSRVGTTKPIRCPAHRMVTLDDAGVCSECASTRSTQQSPPYHASSTYRGQSPIDIPFTASGTRYHTYDARKGSHGPPVLRVSESHRPPPRDDRKDTEAQRQAWFENSVKDKLNIPNGYEDVSVLIVRWDPKIDEYRMGHDKEVSDLLTT